MFNDIMSKIDQLPLHPKNKILLYSRYLFSKISWHFTISDIPKTWICEKLDGVASKYIRKWLELPVTSTLSNVLLPQNKFGLNLILPSTKFLQCQTVCRSALKSSSNKDITNLWAITSTNKNIQYDIYKNTKDVLKAVRKQNEERLKDHLFSQGSFFCNVMSNSTSTFNSLWSFVQSKLPKNIFNFTIRYINNSLPTRKNLTKWGISTTSACSFCLSPESLLHVVAGCKTYLKEGRYTWRHDSVLNFLASTLTGVQSSRLLVDLPGFTNPSVLTGNNLRPDLLLAIENRCLYILELTVGYESNLEINANRKYQKYLELNEELKSNYNEVKFVNLSLSALGVFSKSSKSFDEMLRSLKFDAQCSKYIKKKIVNMCIRTTYYIFCKRNKEWDNPNLMEI